MNRLRFNVKTFPLLRLLLLSTGLFLGANFAWAQPTPEAVKLKQLVLAQQKKNGCAGVWDVLWPEAKKGNEEAKAMLAGAVYALGLNPPGQSEDTINRQRNIFILLVHGGPLRDNFNLPGDKDNRSLKQMLNSYMSSTLAIQPLGRVFLSCLKKTKNSTSCINKMVIGIVPSFDNYAREIDVLAGSGAKAKCLLNPSPHSDDRGLEIFR